MTATGPGSGTLVGPGTISVAAGSALRFTGDFATLGCTGSSTNGTVTIAVGGTSHVLQEPYGAGAVAIFGPYTASATIPYTIELRDGPCQDTVSGSVSVP